MALKKTYYIKSAGKWLKVCKAQEVRGGFLDYVLANGARGLMPARYWLAITKNQNPFN